jgi:hypothetical protein
MLTTSLLIVLVGAREHLSQVAQLNKKMPPKGFETLGAYEDVLMSCTYICSQKSFLVKGFLNKLRHVVSLHVALLVQST